jgi:hypothetical protein
VWVSTFYDVKEAAIADAQLGNAATGSQLKAPAPVAVVNTAHLESTSDASSGIVLKCVKENSKLRVKVLSAGYHADWNVQFPKDLRKEGESYVVKEVVESQGGGFYRIVGDIQQLIV